jgi:hypothetical protein
MAEAALTLRRRERGQVYFAGFAALATVSVAYAVGSVSGLSLLLAAAPAAVLCSLALASFEERLSRVFLVALALLLLGYAFVGRGFAHLGAPPLYLAEPVLFIGSLATLFLLPKARLLPLHWYLFVFMAWGAARTLPYLETDGIDALRDSVTWAYALFAIAVSLAVRPSHYETIAAWFGKLAPVFLCWVPVLFVSNQMFRASLPLAPGSDAHLPYFQAGDVGVHLAGIAAFTLTGLYAYHRRPDGRLLALMAALWLVGFIISGSINRGAFVACVAALGACFLLRPSIKWLPAAVGALTVLAVVAAINPTVPVEGKARNVSIQQAMRNITSIVGGSNDPALEPTKRWRLAWWNKIVDYTVFGPHFWTGKGFGVNLADDDGYQVMQDRSLRSPHNTHLTILARMGVPGLFMWLSLSGIFGLGLLNALFSAREAGQTFRASFIAWLLVYWLAMMVNGSFSLYLEAPQEGIWFWTIFGLGLAILRDEYTGRISLPGRKAVSHEASQVPNSQGAAAAAVLSHTSEPHSAFVQGRESWPASSAGRRLDTAG